MGLFDFLKGKAPSAASPGAAADAPALAADAAALNLIERVCAATEEKDPVAIALRLLAEPAMQRHGPEHGFLVPAVLVAAWSNAVGQGARRAERVAEARRRTLATHTACAAPQGAGTFVAIVSGTAPTGDGRSLPDRMTARALAVVGESGGSRCCKRDALLSILAAARFTREQLELELPAHGVGCETSGRAGTCMGSGCPFNR